ncbi:GNAT family N-acetyltransferase [Ferrimonas lipolytica]|uniref:GNAT family N-acetyltransferase n=1 Tax=Ferrimonas lipolytica TaxID=2724191 RepID=A0A6H1UGM5_9GAMM|nr:GNAT family N-acetyltransferase [Ferrimonas lipolytica]QIZ77473.1 GNAT family N-acetyltransferase [Ferrimonas lipolytica]
MLKNNFFTTSRLCFRQFELTDLDELSTLCADAEVMTYVGDGNPLTQAQTEQWIINSRRNVVAHGYGTGALLDNDSGRLIGWAGISRPDEGGEEIIYGFGREHWGKGLGSELLQGMIVWSQHHLRLSQLRATVDPCNQASIRLLLKHGFELIEKGFEGDVDCDLYCLNMGG